MASHTNGCPPQALFVASAGLSFLACLFHASGAAGQAVETKTSKEEVRTVWDWRGSVLTTAFSRDGAKLVTGGAAKKDSVNVWDLASGRHVVGIDAGAMVYSLEVAPNGKRIATSGFVEKGEDFSPRTAVWSVETGKKLFDIDDPRTGKKPCLAYSPDGKLLATNTLVGDDDKSAGDRGGVPEGWLFGSPSCRCRLLEEVPRESPTATVRLIGRF
jgi:WD40 repeat protein